MKNYYYVEVNVSRFDAAHQCNLKISYACSVANRGGKAHNAPIVAAACAAGDMLKHTVNAGDLLYVVQQVTGQRAVFSVIINDDANDNASLHTLRRVQQVFAEHNLVLRVLD